MKKIVLMLLSLVLMLGIVACDKNSDYTEIKEIPTTVAYANWSSNESNLIKDCLNSETMTISSIRHLPIFKFETKTELDEFKNKYKDDFTMDEGYDEIPSFHNETANYDDNFFKDNTIILAYISASSGSFRYGVSEVTKKNGTLMMTVIQLNDPEAYTEDMAGWFLMAEVEKEYLKDCTKFDAQFMKDTNKISLTTYETEEANQKFFTLLKENSDALTNENNKLIIECVTSLPVFEFNLNNNILSLIVSDGCDILQE